MDRHTKNVLKSVDGNKSEAARLLDIDRRTLQRWHDDGKTFARKKPGKGKRQSR